MFDGIVWGWGLLDVLKSFRVYVADWRVSNKDGDVKRGIAVFHSFEYHAYIAEGAHLVIKTFRESNSAGYPFAQAFAFHIPPTVTPRGFPKSTHPAVLQK